MTKHIIVKLTENEAMGISSFFENRDANGAKTPEAIKRVVKKINNAMA